MRHIGLITIIIMRNNDYLCKTWAKRFIIVFINIISDRSCMQGNITQGAFMHIHIFVFWWEQCRVWLSYNIHTIQNIQLSRGNTRERVRNRGKYKFCCFFVDVKKIILKLTRNGKPPKEWMFIKKNGQAPATSKSIQWIEYVTREFSSTITWVFLYLCSVFIRFRCFWYCK